jgi:hypothetical protein
MPADPPEPVRALLGLCSLLGRRRLGQTRQADIAAATGIGVTRLQRLAGTWRPDRDCPPVDVVEVRALAGFAAGVLGVEERVIGRWLAGLEDGRERVAVVAAIRRLAVAAVERRIELGDVDLPDDLRRLILPPPSAGT